MLLFNSQAFSVATLVLWNGLPGEVQEAPLPGSCKDETRPVYATLRFSEEKLGSKSG